MHWVPILGALTISLAAFALLALRPDAVRASLWLTLDPPSGQPTTSVSVRTIGDGSFGVANMGDAFPLYLVVDEETNELLEVGTVTVDGSRNGTGTFLVPDLVAGDYGVALGCEPCAEFSAGRSLLPVGVFTILPGLPNTATGGAEPAPSTGIWLLGLAALLLALPARRLLRHLRTARRTKA